MTLSEMDALIGKLTEQELEILTANCLENLTSASLRVVLHTLQEISPNTYDELTDIFSN